MCDKTQQTISGTTAATNEVMEPRKFSAKIIRKFLVIHWKQLLAVGKTILEKAYWTSGSQYNAPGKASQKYIFISFFLNILLIKVLQIGKNVSTQNCSNRRFGRMKVAHFSAIGDTNTDGSCRVNTERECTSCPTTFMNRQMSANLENLALFQKTKILLTTLQTLYFSLFQFWAGK